MPLNKLETIASNGNEQPVSDEQSVGSQPAMPEPTPAQGGGPSTEPAPKPLPPWHVFVRTASVQEIKDRVAAEVGVILKRHGLENRCNLALFEPQDSIDSFDLDQIFAALQAQNPDGQKDVILFILSRGGAGEPAYQISKLCKSFAHQKFIVAVPRFAKSAATLIAIGADEIHMGPLGQLGPIDPQIDGLPALGVSQALRTIASVSETYPKSAEMFASRLLKNRLLSLMFLPPGIE